MRRLLVVASVVASAWATTVVAVSVNVLTDDPPAWLGFVVRNALWWTVGSTVAAALLTVGALWAQRRSELSLAELVPAVQQPESWVVDRPEELGKIVRALVNRKGDTTVGITTAVQGAGGFGKTTAARLIRSDRRVLRRFDRRVYWVTLGRDARGGALLELVNNLVQRIDSTQTGPATVLEQAADRLAAVLAKGPPRLVVVDDVWFDDQLRAFPTAGRCARLVTTRIPSLVAGNAVPVTVDRMSPAQATQVLAADLDPAPVPAVLEALTEEIDRWPLLLRLVNRVMVDQARSRADTTAVARDVLQQLRRDGALWVDRLPGAPRGLNVDVPAQRALAVTATIEASTGLLTEDERARLAELAIFVEDETIPVTLMERLWSGTAGLDGIASRALCARLADLALVNLTPTHDGGVVALHDVIRDYLLEQLGDNAANVHQALLDAVAVELPPEPPAAADAGRASVIGWWELPVRARYLREHLVEHLLAAERDTAVEALVTDLRWVQSRLQEAGPIAPLTDLGRITTPRTARLGRLLRQTTHLLTPTDPPHSLLDVLYSRVDHDEDWGPQARNLLDRRTQPLLRNTSTLPDIPHGATRATLTGHTGWVAAVAIAPDGTWLATTSGDRTVRIWDAVTGATRITLTGHTGWVAAVAITSDGTWLATTSDDRTVRIWDAATGATRATLTGHNDLVFAVAIAPDGTWLATTSDDRTVRIWDAATGATRATLTGHNGPVRAVAIAPDGTWLATTSNDRTVRIWDATTGECAASMRVERPLYCCAWSPVAGRVIAGGDAGMYGFHFQPERPIMPLSAPGS